MCDLECKWRHPDGQCAHREMPIFVPHNAPCMLHPITHRCKGLLDQCLSIRWEMASGEWVLRHRQIDEDIIWSIYMEKVGTVKYCPCCGRELNAPAIS